MSQEDTLLEDLKDLADKWEWEIETYIDSEAPIERTMATQQYHDWRELTRMIEEHDNEK